MKQMICKTSNVPPEGHARVFPFFGRKVQVWPMADRIRAAANLCLPLGEPMESKDGAFACHWNGAWSDMIDGRGLNDLAPANARLSFLPTRIEGGDLVDVRGEIS